MLFEMMRLFRQAGDRPLTREEIVSSLNIPPDVLDHMLLTLVQRGRLTRVDVSCTGCDHCPLHKLCGGPTLAPQNAYFLSDNELQQGHHQLNLT